jgi:hypothetical protein
MINPTSLVSESTRWVGSIYHGAERSRFVTTISYSPTPEGLMTWTLTDSPARTVDQWLALMLREAFRSAYWSRNRLFVVEQVSKDDQGGLVSVTVRLTDDPHSHVVTPELLLAHHVIEDRSLLRREGHSVVSVNAGGTAAARTLERDAPLPGSGHLGSTLQQVPGPDNDHQAQHDSETEEG